MRDGRSVLSIYLSVRLSFICYPPIFVSIYLSTYSIRLPTCLSSCLSIYVSIYELSTFWDHLSTQLPIHLFTFYRSIDRSIYLESTCLPIYPSVYLSMEISISIYLSCCFFLFVSSSLYLSSEAPGQPYTSASLLEAPGPVKPYCPKAAINARSDEPPKNI